MMRLLLRVVLVSGFLAGLFVSIHWYYERTRPVIIGFNPGGRLDWFIYDFEDIRRSGRRVVIDGLCISACTMVTGLIPANRVCVTEHAILAFHSASLGLSHSQEGTRLLWQVYPERVRQMLRERGWEGYDGKEHGSLIYIGGDDLLMIFHRCEHPPRNFI